LNKFLYFIPIVNIFNGVYNTKEMSG
jgi:hypothetical protein